MNKNIQGDFQICIRVPLTARTYDIRKLVSQLKLLPSLFELRENGRIDMSTIIKKL